MIDSLNIILVGMISVVNFGISEASIRSINKEAHFWPIKKPFWFTAEIEGLVYCEMMPSERDNTDTCSGLLMLFCSKILRQVAAYVSFTATMASIECFWISLFSFWGNSFVSWILITNSLFGIMFCFWSASSFSTTQR